MAAKKKTKWAKVFRVDGPSRIVFEIGIGNGQVGVASFVWERSDGLIEEFDDSIPEDSVYTVDMPAADTVPFSQLDVFVLVKVVNPNTRRTSVDCAVFQRGRPQDRVEQRLHATAATGVTIVPYVIRITFVAK